MKKIKLVQNITNKEIKGNFYALKVDGMFRFLKKTPEGYVELPSCMLKNCYVKEIKNEK